MVKTLLSTKVEVAGQAKITDIVTTENPNYLFVTINIDKVLLANYDFHLKK
jgi:hypothetical protein